MDCVLCNPAISLYMHKKAEENASLPFHDKESSLRREIKL